MPTLDELKTKWFLTLDDQENALNKRHPGTQLHACTDKNKVVELIDGAAVMKDFHDSLKTLIEFMQANPDTTNPPQVWIALFDFTDVELLGPSSIKADQLLLEAAEKGVIIYFLHSSDLFTQYNKIVRDYDLKPFLEKLNNQKYKEKRTGFASLDERTPAFWSAHHQKIYIFLHPESSSKWKAIVGSADINARRWDTPDHSKDNNPSHEVSVRICGPAVRDIALTFAERWNDDSRRTDPRIDTSITTNFLDLPISSPEGATHSVQVLRTYPIATNLLKEEFDPSSEQVNIGYSWSDQGEFTVWGAYLQAIQGAAKYIYIEDQFFHSFNVPPAFEANPGSLLSETDLVYQLGERIKNGVHVIVVVPEEHDDPPFINDSIIRQKIVSAAYLNNIANQSERGRFVIKTLFAKSKSGGSLPVFVHSKLMIVDDEFVLSGDCYWS